MIDSFRNIFAIPDLRKRVFFTFALLAVYRLGAFIPIPGIDPVAIAEFTKAVEAVARAADPGATRAVPLRPGGRDRRHRADPGRRGA